MRAFLAQRSMLRRWTDDDCRKDCGRVYERARRQVQVAFLFDALAKQLELSIPEEEVQQQVDHIAANVGMERHQQITAFYEREENRRSVAQSSAA